MSKKTKQYTGCIGSIAKARDLARESFVYGLKDKSEFTEISPRSYDEATRQMRDWFQDCLRTRTVKVRSKVKYLSLNCRDYATNPLYKMWKSCSFTTNEMVFFFFLLDHLEENTKPVGLSELYLDYDFLHRTGGFQRSAAQKWLQNKGCRSGIIMKQGRSRYCLPPAVDLSEEQDLLSYYSEIAPCGVIGSFIQDKYEDADMPFRFKQHYIGQAFDSEILCNVLYAIKANKSIRITYLPRNMEQETPVVYPVRVYSSTQNGRQYLMAWEETEETFYTYRLDHIREIDILERQVHDHEAVRNRFDMMKNHMWGVSTGDDEIIHVEFSIKVEENEGYIVNRLNREKRCGKVSAAEGRPGIMRFEADVYDPQEMFPWIRSFICRIVELKVSDKKLEDYFWESVKRMNELYFMEEDLK